MAVLVALLLFFGTRTLINIAFEEHEPEKPGFEVAGTDEKPDGKEEKPGGGSEIIAALHSADAAQGEADAGLCKVCHTFDKGGATLVGPNLYDVVGKKIASHEGVTYTPALKAKEGDWTFETLDVWLTNPQAFAPGTTMAFPGIPDLKKRANVIAFLRSKSDKPVPLPEPKAAEAAPEEAAEDAGEKPAGEAAGGQPEVLVLMASADPAKGEAAAALCKVCHTFDKGGATLVGPNLYGIVGQKIASHEGVTYTPALKAMEGDWTYETLDVWLTNPQAFAPGTTMAFPGIPDAKKRADVIAFLRSKADTPVPLPQADATPAEEPAAEQPAATEEPAESEEAAPAEEPAAEEPEAEEEPAPAQEPAAEEPAESEEAAPAEEPAAEEPEAEEEPAPAQEPAAEEPAAEEESAPAEEPAAEEGMEETMEETVVVPPTVSEDAPSEPSVGEPPSASQPQPVYPDGPPEAAASEDVGSDDMGADDTGSDDAGGATGEEPSSSQPQPVYPDGPPEGL